MSIKDDLVRFVQESLLRGAEEIGPDDSLIDRGIIDSIGLMQLLTFIEDNAGVRIPDQMVTPDHFQSVSAMTTMIDELKSR